MGVCAASPWAMPVTGWGMGGRGGGAAIVDGGLRGQPLGHADDGMGDGRSGGAGAQEMTARAMTMQVVHGNLRVVGAAERPAAHSTQRNASAKPSDQRFETRRRPRFPMRHGWPATLLTLLVWGSSDSLLAAGLRKST